MPAEEFADAVLGVLELDRTGQSWCSTIELDGRIRHCQIRCGTREALENWLPYARSVIATLRDNHSNLAIAVADALLTIYNSTWRHGDPPLDSEAFAASLSLEGVAIDRVRLQYIRKGEALATVMYDANGLFGDHGIALCLDAKARPIHVELA